MDNKYIMRKVPMRIRKLIFTSSGYETGPPIPPNYVVCRTSEDRGSIKSVITNEEQGLHIFQRS